MKKKSFLSGFGAKIAFAAVALTTVVFTSCEEENFNVDPVVTPNANVTIVANVYDLISGNVLNQSPKITKVDVASDGSVAEQTVTVSCPAFTGSENYLTVADQNVYVPALEKGQSAVIPVTFYTQTLTSAATNVSMEFYPNQEPLITEYTGAGFEDKTYGPYEVQTVFVPEIKMLQGSVIENIDEVYAQIEGIVASRAITNANLESVMKAIVDTYNRGYSVETNESLSTEWTAEANKSYTFGMTPEISYQLAYLLLTVDGTEYTIENIELYEAGTTWVSVNQITHDSHSHDHGGNSNAGGGSAGK